VKDIGSDRRPLVRQKLIGVTRGGLTAEARAPRADRPQGADLDRSAGAGQVINFYDLPCSVARMLYLTRAAWRSSGRPPTRT